MSEKIMQWFKISLNLCEQIKSNEKSVLFRMPKCFSGYCFWIAKKLIKGDYFICNDQFQFKLWSKEKEKFLSANEMQKYLGEWVDSERVRTEIIYPDKLDPISSPKPLEELKR